MSIKKEYILSSLKVTYVKNLIREDLRTINFLAKPSQAEIWRNPKLIAEGESKEIRIRVASEVPSKFKNTNP